MQPGNRMNTTPADRGEQQGSGTRGLATVLVCLILATFWVQVVCTPAWAAQLALLWDPSGDSDVVGYNVYYGTQSGHYTTEVNAGNTTTYTVSNLQVGSTYYFAATAYDSYGYESAYSNELSYTVPSACTYSISPTSQTFPSAGGTGSVSVTTQNSCAWTAASGASWMSVTSGGSGTGGGAVAYSVAANSGTASRIAASTIAGLAFAVTEAGTTTYYTITASAGTGGTISPSGSVSVNYGANQTFSITPASGYTIGSVTVDGASVGAVSSYTFSNVTANHTIGASFTGNGSSSVLTSVTVSPVTASVAVNGTLQFTATANDQSGNAMTPQPTFSWSVSGGGTITSNGLFTAGTAAGGPYVITAATGGVNGTAAVSVTTSSSITIGETNILSGDDSGNGNLLVAQQTSLGQTATVVSMSFYVTTVSGSLRMGIFDATGPGGGPGNLMAQTASITPVTGWNTANVVSPVSLPAGTYWIAYLPSSNSLGFKVDLTGSAAYYTYTYGTLPTTFSTSPMSTTAHWSFYATLQTAE